MDGEFYKGYSIWGHAIWQGISYAASGTITQRNKLVEASGVLGCFGTEEEATSAGLDWCRAWVDKHG